MNYETRKRRLKRLIRPEPGYAAECCGTLVVRPHRYAATACECARTFDEAPPMPRRVSRLLDGISPEIEERLTRELVDEFRAESR